MVCHDGILARKLRDHFLTRLRPGAQARRHDQRGAVPDDVIVNLNVAKLHVRHD
ncbi:Uncharacterised protein [Bordetella pertussis]|nr:Uncharacterised protein [Bordetella pertussis]